MVKNNRILDSLKCSITIPDNEYPVITDDNAYPIWWVRVISLCSLDTEFSSMNFKNIEKD